ncbi:hypothetical protein DZG01_14040 [Pseudomonas fluorescens]|nr:hypothetical protein DZG01_14040 [Pseudomonas fluorescens]
MLRFDIMLRFLSHTKPVGASLLAMALDQPSTSATDLPLSRASSLPQGVFTVSGFFWRLSR